MKNKQQGQFWQILMILTALTIFGKAAQSISAQTDAPDEQNRISQFTKLTANDGTFDDNFGWVVAVAGDTAVIGAPNDDIGANTNQGSAYVFVRTAGVWTFQQKLTASDGAAGDLFGHSVAVANASGAPAQTVIMVGAVADDIGANPNQGSVYVFVRSSAGGSFIPQGKLTASDGVANDSFGASVAMTGSFTVIGANGVDVTNTDQGAAYIFVRNGSVWQEEQKLTVQSGVQQENMGWDVDISGTSVIIGTNQQNASGQGIVYIFTRPTGGNTWLVQFSIASAQKFGTSVAISGNTAVIGNLAANFNGNTSQGTVSVFTRTGTIWGITQGLMASDGAAGDEFGRSIAVSGNTIVVGAHFDALGGNNAQGSAYVFTRFGNVWAQRQKLLDSTGAIGDRFGNSVAISDGTIMVGAWQDDVGPLGQAGSASIFYLTAPFDFDGDGKSDISVFRPSNGAWYIQQSASNFTGVTFGFGTDIPIPADYDGDGKTDVAIFRPSDGGWYRLNSSNGTFTGLQWGISTDIPRPGDYDGDGKADVNVFRPSTGKWYRLNSLTGVVVETTFGQNGDKPLIADFDGDGKTDTAVFRPSAGAFYSLDSSTGAFRGAAFGFGTDIPTPADFDGDGKTDVAVFRPSDGGWYRLNSSTGAFFGTAFGQNGDIPLAADYDGDGKADVAVFRNGNWYRLNSSNGAFAGQAFGFGTDKPIPASF